MRLIDADELLADFKVRAINARNWKENAILNGNEEATIRADATIAFLTEVKLTIEKAPTIEPKWIPITERLPEEEGDYLLWGKIDENEEDEYSFIGSYDEGFERFGIWHEQFESRTLGSLGSEFYEYSKVVAWMPLPEPYKRGDV